MFLKVQQFFLFKSSAPLPQLDLHNVKFLNVGIIDSHQPGIYCIINQNQMERKGATAGRWIFD